MTNVSNWIWLDNSRKLEDQVKYFIACETEGYLNGINDCGLNEYPSMTKDQWINYVSYGLEIAINDGIIINGAENKHLRFYGKDKFIKLIETYIDNYKYIQPYIIK